jgi:glycosyltransferase involved in cell wall biosynthesis
MRAGSALGADTIERLVRRVLAFLTSSYPYGPGETFVSLEVPYLKDAFDEVVIVSNDTESAAHYTVPEGVTCLRVPYELGGAEKLRSPLALLDREPREELGRIRAAYGLPVSGGVRNTVVLAWAKANKFSRILRRIAEERSDAEVQAYSYWANDMAVAAALARARGWVHRAVCRAHRWDVYFENSAVGYLPFRRYLAEHLDHYRFISEDGLRYFREREGRDYPSLEQSNLGTRPIATEPLGDRDPFVVLSCSNMIPRKRVESIAEALGRLRRSLTWIHIGDGPSRGAVERAVARLPDSIQVELPGALSNSEVLETYRTRRPSLFVNLSDSEGVPVAIMEAMSAGVPVLATDVGGVGEIVTDGRNGVLLAPQSDVARVGEAIEAFIDMPDDEYGRYARAAWSTWNKEFNAEVNYPGFVTEVFGRSRG